MTFYDIAPHAHPTYYWAQPVVAIDDELELLRNGPVGKKPMAFKVNTGRRPGDVIADFVWSDRMVNAISNSGAEGFHSHPVRVIKGDAEIPGYRLVQVTGVGGPFDQAKSKAQYSGDALIDYSGIYMDESQWDGSDVFTIPGLHISIFVIDRIAHALTALKLTNVSIERAEDASM